MIDRSRFLFRQERAVWLKHLALFVVFVQLPSRVWLFATPWTAAHQASRSLTIYWNLPKFMFIPSVMSSSHLILWCPLLLLPSIFPSITNFSSELSVHIRWPKWVLPMSVHGWFPLRLTGLTSLLSKGLSGVFSSTTVWGHQFFGILPSLRSSSHNRSDHWEDHSLDYMDLCWQSNVSVFQHTVEVCHIFPAKKKTSDFMAAVTIHSDFRALRGNLSLLPPFPLLFSWNNSTRCHDLSFWFFFFFDI